MTVNIIIAFITCLLCLAAACIFIPANRFKPAFIIIALVAVLLRISIMFYLYRNGTDKVGTDGLLYHMEGIMIANQLKNGVSIFDVQYSYTIYTVFVGLIYYIFGVSRYIVSFINIIFAFSTGIILFRIALNHKYHFANAALISLAFLYFPNIALWTADTRKEAFLILVCFLCWFSVQRFIINLKQKGSMFTNYLHIIFICLILWFSTLIRLYMFIPLMLGVVASQTVLYIKKRYRICLIFIIATVISSVLIFVGTMYPLTNGYHAVSFQEDQTGNVLQDMDNKLDKILSIVMNRNIFMSIVDYLVLPYPGNIDIADIKGSSKVTFIVQVDMIAWYICLALIMTGIYSTIKKRDSFFIGLLVFITAYVLINATLVENVSDTIYRYRSVIVGLMILFIDGNVLRDILKRLHVRHNVSTLKKSSL